MKKKNPFKTNTHEIKYNLINCGISSGLVFLGGMSSGEITMQGIGMAVIAGLIVFFTKFKNYWAGERKEYSTKIFNFI